MMQSEAQAALYQPANVGIFQEFSQAWLACMGHIMENGHEVMDGELRLRETLNVSASAYHCSESDFLACGASEDRMRLMLLKYGSQSILSQYNMSYGRLFRRHGGVDQIKWLVNRLRRNRDAKSATIGFHIPGAADLSCISLLDCKIRGDALHLTSIFRSQNVYASQPGNVCALRELQKEMAHDLQVSTGVLTLHVMSAHIYEDDWGRAREIISRNGGIEAVQSSCISGTSKG